MNHFQVVSREHINSLQSPFRCIKCGEGSMIYAVREGEQDYTDNYLCEQCHHHDNIPTNGILASQLATSLLGLVLSMFLLYDYVLTIQGDNVSNAEVIALGMVVGAFICGFVYVLHKAYLGYKLRKSYLKD